MRQYRNLIYSHPEIKKICSLIGHLCIVWNEIELLWYLIYTCLLHESPREKNNIIFTQFITGAAQRQLIAALAEHAFKDLPPYKKRFGQLLARTHDLVGDRNAFLHGDYFFGARNGIPFFSIGPGNYRTKKPNKMTKKHLETELTKTIERMHKLSDDLDEFRLILAQEFLPKDKRARPMSPENLAAIPKNFRDSLPRDLRERVAPPEFRAKDEE